MSMYKCFEIPATVTFAITDVDVGNFIADTTELITFSNHYNSFGVEQLDEKAQITLLKHFFQVCVEYLEEKEEKGQF